MKLTKRRSLKRRLTIQLLLFQIGSIVIVTLAFFVYMLSDGTGSALLSSEAAQITANALIREPDGKIVLKETPEYAKLRRETPDFWFVALTENDDIIQGGPVPEAFSDMGQTLNDVRIANIRDAGMSYSYFAVLYVAIVRRVSGPAGEFAMIGHGGPFSMTLPILLFSNILILPVLALVSIATIAAIPGSSAGNFARSPPLPERPKPSISTNEDIDYRMAIFQGRCSRSCMPSTAHCSGWMMAMKGTSVSFSMPPMNCEPRRHSPDPR